MAYKSIQQTSSINIALKFTALGLIFVFQSMLSKITSVEDYSLFSKLIMYGGYTSILFSLGLSASLVYFPKNSKEYIHKFISVLILYTVMGVAMLVISLQLLSVSYIYIYILIFSFVLNYTAVALSYYQFTGKFILYGFLGLIQAILIVLILPVMYIYQNSDIQIILELYIGANTLYAASMILYIYIKHKASFIYRMTLNKQYIVYGGKVISLIFISQLIYMADFILIDYYMEDKYLAYYFVALIISKLIFVLADTSGNILFPIYSKIKGNKEKQKIVNKSMYTISSIIFIVSMGILMFFGVFGRSIIELLYTSEYTSAHYATLLLISGTHGMIIYKLLSRKLAAENKWKNLYISVCISATLNIILNLFLIPRYGLEGAAFSSMVSYWVCGFLLVFLSKERLSDYLFFKNNPV